MNGLSPAAVSRHMALIRKRDTEPELEKQPVFVHADGIAKDGCNR